MELIMSKEVPLLIADPIRREFDHITRVMKIATYPHFVDLKFLYRKPIIVPRPTKADPTRVEVNYNGGLTRQPDPGSFKVKMLINVWCAFNQKVCAEAMDQDAGDYLKTFRHEMGHVWQYVTGKLRAMEDDSGLCYDNKFFPVEQLNNSFKEYYAEPWEVEARAFADHFTRFQNVSEEFRKEAA